MIKQQPIKPDMRIYAFRPLLLTLVFLVLMQGAAPAGEAPISRLLPVSGAVKGVTPSGEYRLAEGEKLYQLINGGAVLYFRHGFKRAVFQDYQLIDGSLVTVEIYLLGSPDNARAVFESKKGSEGTELSVGDAGQLAGYYCLLQQGPYFISITGEKPTESLRKILVELASWIAVNIP